MARGELVVAEVVQFVVLELMQQVLLQAPVFVSVGFMTIQKLKLYVLRNCMQHTVCPKDNLGYFHFLN